MVPVFDSKISDASWKAAPVSDETVCVVTIS